MKNSSLTVQIIEPEEGKWLTQAADVADADRVFSEKVFLGANDSADNWIEVSDEYKTQVEAAVAAEAENALGDVANAE